MRSQIVCEGNRFVDCEGLKIFTLATACYDVLWRHVRRATYVAAE